MPTPEQLAARQLNAALDARANDTERNAGMQQFLGEVAAGHHARIQNIVAPRGTDTQRTQQTQETQRTQQTQQTQETQRTAPAHRESSSQSDDHGSSDQGHDSESKYDGGEMPPQGLLDMQTWNPFRGKFYSWKNWKPFWTSTARRAAFLGGSAATFAAYSTFLTGTVLSQIPGIAWLGNAGLSIGSGLATVAGMPAWLPPLIGTAVPTIATLGALYGLGRGYGWIQKNVFGDKIPDRSITKNIWVGLTSPFRLAGRTAKYIGESIWANKRLAIGTTVLGGALFASGAATPVGAAIISNGLGLAALAEGKEGGGASAEPAPH